MFTAPRTFAVPRRPAVEEPPKKLLAWGPPRVTSIDVECECQGLFRVADPAIVRYELYRGVGGAQPDFTADPWETFTALPHDTAALPADDDYTFVLRRRNQWNLLSLNVDATEISVDPGGDETPSPPSAPDPITATATAGGTVTIAAYYSPLLDGGDEPSSRAADTWLLYLTTNGVDPDPALDTPTESDITDADGVAKFSYVTTAQLEGTVVKAIVRVRRSGTPDADSTNDTIVTATATLLGPSAVSPADTFLGRADRQG